MAMDATGTCQYVSLADYVWDIVPADESKPRCHGIALPWNPTVICLFVAFTAVSIWISLETNIQAMFTFRRWSTIYFWSIIFTAWAIILYAISVTLMFLTDAGKSYFLKEVIYPIARVFTTSGFIAVLYSRLYLILDAPRVLKYLAWFLICVGIPFQVFLVVASTGVPFNLGWTTHLVAYRMEVIVTLVEIALGSFYIYIFGVRFMKDGAGLGGSASRAELRWTFILLILGEMFVVLGDVAITTVWLTGLFLVRLSIDPLIYGLKLKVEFLILNRLTGMTRQRVELRHIAISMDAGSIDNAGTATAMVTPTPVQDFCATHNQHAINMMERKHSSDSGNAGSSQQLDAKGERTRVAPCGTVSPQELGMRSLEIRESLDSIDRQYLGRVGLQHTADIV